MTPAIKLAKECWHAIVRMPTSETTSEWYPAPASVEELERFYTKAQAAALREAAEVLSRGADWELYPSIMYRMADELEQK